MSNGVGQIDAVGRGDAVGEAPSEPRFVALFGYLWDIDALRISHTHESG
jgi:hypothetical protein